VEEQFFHYKQGRPLSCYSIDIIRIEPFSDI